MFFQLALSLFVIASCGSARNLTTDTQKSVAKNLEGVKVSVEEVVESGVEKSECLNEEGTKIIERPYVWFAGRGKADNKQVAIELAQSEAYATISRVLRRAVLDQSERGNVVNNGRLQQAVTQYWKQVSSDLLKGCTPFGKTRIEYDPATRMYDVTAKVAIRGDRFNELMQTAGSFTKDLTGEELEQFVEINKFIMKSAKGE